MLVEDEPKEVLYEKLKSNFSLGLGSTAPGLPRGRIKDALSWLQEQSNGRIKEFVGLAWDVMGRIDRGIDSTGKGIGQLDPIRDEQTVAKGENIDVQTSLTSVDTNREELVAHTSRLRTWYDENVQMSGFSDPLLQEELNSQILVIERSLSGDDSLQSQLEQTRIDHRRFVEASE